MRTLFDPEGRIDPATFREAAFFLIGVAAVLSLLPLAAPSLTIASSLVGVVLLYPWLVIWVKRLHDAGKSGWMFLVVLVLWLIANLGVHFLISGHFAPTPNIQPTNISEALATITAKAQATAIPNTISSVVISLLFILGGNALLKSQLGPNAYDPPSHLR